MHKFFCEELLTFEFVYFDNTGQKNVKNQVLYRSVKVTTVQNNQTSNYVFLSRISGNFCPLHK